MIGHQLEDFPLLLNRYRIYPAPGEKKIVVDSVRHCALRRRDAAAIRDLDLEDADATEKQEVLDALENHNVPINYALESFKYWFHDLSESDNERTVNLCALCGNYAVQRTDRLARHVRECTGTRLGQVSIPQQQNYAMLCHRKLILENVLCQRLFHNNEARWFAVVRPDPDRFGSMEICPSTEGLVDVSGLVFRSGLFELENVSTGRRNRDESSFESKLGIRHFKDSSAGQMLHAPVRAPRAASHENYDVVHLCACFQVFREFYDTYGDYLC